MAGGGNVKSAGCLVALVVKLLSVGQELRTHLHVPLEIPKSWRPEWAG